MRMQIDRNDLDEFLSCRRIEDAFQRKISIVAIVTRILQKLGYQPPIIVGGTAVSIYTNNTYATVDVDLISNAENAAIKVLLELGYTKQGKDFYHDELESIMEFPSRNYLEDNSRFKEYTDPLTNSPVYLIAIEDLILDRLGSYHATRDLSSKEWASRLMLTYYEELDWSYVHKSAHARGFFDDLEKIQQQVKWLRRNESP
jgi:hypothetical protein